MARPNTADLHPDTADSIFEAAGTRDVPVKVRRRIRAVVAHPLSVRGRSVALHLRHEAERRGSTVSDLTREAIETFLGAQTGRRKFLAGGAGASGRDDISERIEEILAAKGQPSL